MSKTQVTVSHFLPQNLFMYFDLHVFLGCTTATTRSNQSCTFLYGNKIFVKLVREAQTDFNPIKTLD